MVYHSYSKLKGKHQRKKKKERKKERGKGTAIVTYELRPDVNCTGFNCVQQALIWPMLQLSSELNKNRWRVCIRLEKRVPGSQRWRWHGVWHCPKERVWGERLGQDLGWRFLGGDSRWSWRCRGISFRSTIPTRLCREIQRVQRRQRKIGIRAEKQIPWLKLKLNLGSEINSTRYFSLADS